MTIISQDLQTWKAFVLSWVRARALTSSSFWNEDIYKCKAMFDAHPQNDNVEAKIRQCLQLLVDDGVVGRLAPGHYTILPHEVSPFQQEIEASINRYSMETGSDTPDFILAQYLTDCLAAWNRSVRRREEWYGRVPGLQREREPA